MIVSENKKFLFLHNPKAGGTSIRSALMPWDTRNNYFWGITFDSQTGWNIDKAHMPLHVLSRLYPGVRALMNDYVTFGFSRHPFDRFVSAFNETFPDKHQKVNNGSLSLDEYAKAVEDYASQMVAGGTWNPSFTHATPQVPLFCEGRKCLADVIIPIEKPFPKVRYLARLLGEPGGAVAACFGDSAEQKNVRKPHAKPQELLAPGTLSRLADFYAEDFEFLGYTP